MGSHALRGGGGRDYGGGTSFDGRGAAMAGSLGYAGRSYSSYGGYSDTEVMGPSTSDRYYGRDPYRDHQMTQDDRRFKSGSCYYYDDDRLRGGGSGGGGGYLGNEDLGGLDRVRRPPPPPPRIPLMGGKGRAATISADPVHHPEFIDSDMESVTSAFSSQSAPHFRAARRTG